MPRLAGQIDQAKSEAILDAAVDVLAERGLAAPIEDIARRAGVSKQTIYNHYGSKAELVRALVERRVEAIIAPLQSAQAQSDPEAALVEFARVMLTALILPRSTAMVRLYILGASEMPDLARLVFEAGPKASRQHLARFLDQEHQAGRMVIDDAGLAAQFFAGMVIGSYQIGELMGVDSGLSPAVIDEVARNAAARFLRAYAS